MADHLGRSDESVDLMKRLEDSLKPEPPVDRARLKIQRAIMKLEARIASPQDRIESAVKELHEALDLLLEA